MSQTAVNRPDAAEPTELKGTWSSGWNPWALPYRLEVVPVGDVSLRVVTSVPPGEAIAVTCSPTHGVDRTVATCEALAERGYSVTPHLAARAFRSAAHLREVAYRLAACGVTDVFVVGGDGEPTGAYLSGVDLVEAMASIRDRPQHIGVPAYPEGHPAIPDGVLHLALKRKAEVASYVVTQMCFDATRLSEWLGERRAEGIDLPVALGVPGPVGLRRLIELSMRLGVGSSAGFLLKNTTAVRSLLGRKYDAGRLIRGTRDSAGDQVDGLHVFTFNNVEASVRWLQATA
jgi:methylenetetrahydrofolate reductase (NADPH)